jgi:CDP-diacylglycerol---glycerol-3-phosphate 3-phosphatidyltransferase
MVGLPDLPEPQVAEGGNGSRMNLSISLTLLRIFFVPLLVVLLLTKGENLDLWAVGVFLLAAATDLLDGYLARRRRQVTTMGTLLDPVADKLLTCSAFISLVELGLIPAWMVVIIVGRELAVSGLRAIASAEGFVIRASELGKTKMVLQVFAITAIVLGHHFAALTGYHAGIVLVWLVMLFAVVSAGQYTWSFWKNLEARDRRKGVVILHPGHGLVEEEKEREKDVAAH